MRHFLGPLVITCLVAISATKLSAADPLQKLDPSKPVGAIVTEPEVRGSRVLTPEQNDRRILRWIAVDNDALLAWAEHAATHSKNEAVRAMAAEMADDHKQLAAKLKPQPAARTTDDARPRVRRERSAVLVQDGGRSRDGAPVYRPTDFVAVKEHVGAELDKIVRKEMGELEGDAFDRAFTAHMLFGHDAIITSIDVLDGNASATLHDELVAIRATLVSHREKLREFAATRGEGEGAAKSKKPTDSD